MFPEISVAVKSNDSPIQTEPLLLVVKGHPQFSTVIVAVALSLEHPDGSSEFTVYVYTPGVVGVADTEAPDVELKSGDASQVYTPSPPEAVNVTVSPMHTVVSVGLTLTGKPIPELATK